MKILEKIKKGIDYVLFIMTVCWTLYLVGWAIAEIIKIFIVFSI